MSAIERDVVVESVKLIRSYGKLGASGEVEIATHAFIGGHADPSTDYWTLDGEIRATIRLPLDQARQVTPGDTWSIRLTFPASGTTELGAGPC